MAFRLRLLFNAARKCTAFDFTLRPTASSECSSAAPVTLHVNASRIEDDPILGASESARAVCLRRRDSIVEACGKARQAYWIRNVAADL
jgi:hypothetical protein